MFIFGFHYLALIANILQYHNDYRANVNPPSNAMMKLIWNAEGAARALSWLKNCTFAHDSGANRATSTFTSGGQNLFLTTSKTPDWNTPVKAWHDEVSIFKFGETTNVFKEVGHYTQVVWGNTKEIGCAMNVCANFTLMACNYYPPGNFPPYYVPYQRSTVQSCDGCLNGSACATTGPYKGKLLEKCSLFCTNQFSNCDRLVNWCSLYAVECAKSCNPRCK